MRPPRTLKPLRFLQRMPLQGSRVALSLLILLGCVEPYNFVVHDPVNGLVVEAEISDKSLAETLSFPSDGRFFTVRLRRTSDVTNLNDAPVEDATVTVIDDQGAVWNYWNLSDGSGIYYLPFSDLKALPGRRYKLHVEEGTDVYESSWEQLPVSVPVGNISFEETRQQAYDVRAGQKVIVDQYGVNVYVDLGLTPPGQSVYYDWSFDPLYVYVAPLSNALQPGHKCWIQESTFLNTPTLHKDNVGGYKWKLFFLQTKDNLRVYQRLSVLVTQRSLSPDYYEFLSELQAQVESSGLHDAQPFNLPTNMKNINGDKPVSGFFGVAAENATRWYFSRNELSYFVEDDNDAYCHRPVRGPFERDPSCSDCRAFGNGSPTNMKPSWWQE